MHFATSSMTKLLVAGMLLSAANAVHAQTAMKMVLDWNIEGQHSPYALAVDSGIFAKHGLSVTVDRGSSSGDTVTKVAAGTYDVGLADLGSIIAFNAKQGGIKLITIFQAYDQAPSSIMSIKGYGVATPADLNGKKIAAPVGDSSRVMFPLFAKANNVDAASIQWVDVTAALRRAVLMQHQVDAISGQTSEVITFRTLGVKDADLIVFRYSDLGVKIYGHAIFTTPEYAASHQNELKQFLAAVAEAWKATIKDPKASIAVIKKWNPLIDEAIELQRLDLMLHDAIAPPDVVKNGFSKVDPARLKYTVDSVTLAFNLPTVANATELWHPEFLPPASELQYPK
jgi:NitT/TauT family transport system substrate-binding protein